MKKRNKFSKFAFEIICLLSTIFIIPFFSISMIKSGAMDTSISFKTDFLLKDSYAVKDVVEFPKLENVKLGEQSATQAVLILPDGQVISAEGNIEFNQSGDYLYRVYAKNLNKVYSKDIKFNVKNNTFTFKGNSIVSYCELEQKFNPTNDPMISISNGVRVSLAVGDTLTYNRPIQLADEGLTNVITLKDYSADNSFIMTIRLTDVYNSNNYFEYYIAATKNATNGTRRHNLKASFLGNPYVGFQKQTIVDELEMGNFTYFIYDDPYDAGDYYDTESDTLKTYYKMGKAIPEVGNVKVEYPKGSGTMVTVDASKVVRFPNNTKGVYYIAEDTVDVNTQAEVKSECVKIYSNYFIKNPSSMATEENDKRYWPVLYNYRNLNGGADVITDLETGLTDSAFNNKYLSLNYDAKKQICSYGVDQTNSKAVINDFNFSDFYRNNKFGGFLANEVYLSITVERDGLSDLNKVDFEIADIAGHNSTSGVFSESQIYVDDEAPMVTIDFDSPIAYAAQNCAFPLPTATVFDANLKDFHTEVYYNYGNSDEYFVSNDGERFIPQDVGKYTVVYKAVDSYGNVTERLLPVICVKTPSGEMVTSKIGQEYFDNLVAKAGYNIYLPTLEQMGISSINGELVCQVIAVHNGVEYPIGEDFVFTTLDIGEWKIIYRITDALCTTEKTFDIYVGSSDYIGFIQAPVFPKYFIKNAPYSVEDFPVYSFVGGKKVVNASVSIKYDGSGDFEKISDGYIAKIEGNDYLEIQYSVDDKIIYISECLPIVDVGFDDELSFSMANYFKGDFNKSAVSRGIFFVSQTNSGENRIDFINAIDATNFVLILNDVVERTAFDNAYSDTIAYPNGYFSNYNKIKIILTDYYDVTNTVEIEFVKTRNGSTFYVDGVASETAAPSFSQGINLKYDTSSETFVADNAKVTKKLSFVSNKCYVSVVLEEIQGEAGILISKINNQNLSNADGDKAAPNFNFDYDANIQNIGAVYKLNVPTVIDVLSTVIDGDMQISVVSPSEQPVSSVDNILLSNIVFDRNFEFVLEEYGDYRITITYRDSANRKASYNVMVSVACTERPTIEFTDGTFVGETIAWKVGEEVAFKHVTGYDVIEQTLQTEIFVFEPNGVVHYVKQGSVYLPDKAGTYKVVYRVCTSDGRYNTTYYYLNVN